MERPSKDTPMVELKPTISQNLLEQVKNLKPLSHLDRGDLSSSIPLGTKCKNNACKQSYEGPESLSTICVHHAGVPVFHEGLKFWSCCTKKTTEFSAFLEQEGCTHGQHVWFKKTAEKGQVKCRLDWFQTGSTVVVSIFGKKYDPLRSKVLLSPVRLKVDLYFPEEDGNYQQDIELRGIEPVSSYLASGLTTEANGVQLKNV
ncbi:cysteine and histidine-rich domain-containing protein 1 [Diaphorina citri]|uniref:Cysteine and histidine-rich domain-containing protein 1 n=1 Tax=Diaphorina citri TaxID=121845 RepID=A0A1S4EBJ8_DIACI|nr:cysteine and histidine-rich domain-containing protein 1 [Diaphorina citri]